MKIAYLAPELPALSATFVYNEILELEEQGVDVQYFSVHRPASIATDHKLEAMRENTRYLYAQSKLTALLANISVLLQKPVAYVSVLGMLLADIVRLGVVTRTAIGQVMRFFYGAYLAKLLCKQKVQHLHIHFAHVPTDIGMYACKLAGIPYSVTSHANDLFERGWLIKQKVERSAFFGSISAYNIKHIESLGAPSDRLVITRCGVDDRIFPPIDKTHHIAANTIGGIGRLVEKKGFDTLIKAVAVLKQRDYPVTLKLAGGGPLEQELKQLAIARDLEEEVKFLGPLAHSEVPAYLSELDAFVLPCKTDSNGDMDGIPVVLMEAMLSGLPVITTRLSGIPELVVDGYSGLLIEPEDEMALANAIQQLLGDAELQARLVKDGAAHVADEFSLRTNVQRLMALFEKAIGDSQ
ncbi:glycosyltransferase family 4 protein [Teredinibacter turnerae]|uniref:glycosyltransferase family 4 protein n=1 Tax=Teredinibacter turnerae TaxID=2426 RepID=UPI00036F8688|nr:glycosyltransferase family 4 protein [Teredinibacter turnerae]